MTDITMANQATFGTTDPVRADHPAMSSDGQAIWNGNEGWFWVLLEPDGESFYITLDAVGPVAPWMQYILDTDGLNCAMFPNCTGGEDFAKELLQMGVAPDMRIFIHMSFSAGQDYNGEYWDEQEWEMLDKEKLSPSEVLDRWVDWVENWMQGRPYLVHGGEKCENRGSNPSLPAL